MNQFKDKIIWITGASSGIGKELAIQLANKGSFLVLSARNELALKALQKTLPNSESHLVLPLDLAKNEHFELLTQQVIQKYERIDYVFNSGGVSQRAAAGATTMEVDRHIMEVNYFGNIALCKAVLPYMRKQKNGYFVVTSSISGKFGFFLRSAYAASKHALHGFYESLALEEEENNIKVTLICPGKINTPISKNALLGDGRKYHEMDHNQATGMSATECVKEILKAVAKNKKEVLIGNKEILAVYFKRYWPWLFYKIIRKQSAT